MPVNVAALDTLTLHPIAGVQLGIASAGIKTVGKKDITLITCDEGTSVAGVFTQNRFCAAPVLICRKQLAAGHSIRALVINTGNANAGTGEQGLRDAQLVCQATAELLGVSAEQVLPFSTGVILQPLPTDKIVAALPQAKADLAEDRWLQAAPAIMTTDIVPKAASCQLQLDGKTISITGISKGSGMIHPNMATMLGYVATDAAVAPDVLQQLLSDVADRSFNCVTVDGDTSTNDSFILLASGKAQNTVIDSVEHPDYATLRQAILTISQTLAQAIARDGEGATKFITVNVEGANNWQEGKTIAYAIAKSPLVKTAMFASDPNLGRILAAVGYAGIDDLDVAKLEIWLGDVLVAQHGGVAASYTEEQGQRVMNEAEITITVKLNRGSVDTFVWTCDFSYDYVRINADYRS